MKKHLFIFAAVAAVVPFVSCSKDLAPESSDEIIIPADRVVTFEAGFEYADDSTRISFGEVADKKMPVLWSSGDAFKLLTCKTEKYYTDTLKKSVTATGFTDCGSFTTAQDGVTTASFTGTIPGDAVSATEGIAIFPSSAYAKSSAKVTVASTVAKSLVGLSTSIPAEQDGTGAKYMIAAARLMDGQLSAFTWATSLVKIKVKAGLGIDRIELSTQNNNAYGLANKEMSMYYYMSGTSRTLSTSVSSGNQLNTLTVSRDGEELSGDVYFATRNLKATISSADSAEKAVLYLRFYKGTQISKTYKWTVDKGYGGGKVIDFKTEFDPVFPEQTVITYKDTDKIPFVPAYPDTVAGERFPWVTGNKTDGYYLHNVSSTSNLKQSWFRTERDYTFGGYTWTFGTTAVVDSDPEKGVTGKYGYTGSSSYILRIEEKSYIKIPVVEGKRLVALSMTINNADNKVWWRISSKNTASSDDPGLLTDNEVKISKAAPLTVSIPGTEINTRYYLVSASSWQPKTLSLYYQ